MSGSTLDATLLALRFAAALVLLGFVGAVFAVLWADYRAAVRALEASRRQHGRLIVLDGTAQGLGVSYPLMAVTTLGRSPANTIVLDDSFASQEHALVVQRAGQWWLEDRRSSNGTRLNGEPITEPVVISSGDVIEIGRVSLRIELE